MYMQMVFNSTIPGPVISIDQGDTLNITLKNEGQTIHSLDFHAGFSPSKAVSGSVKPGEERHGHFRRIPRCIHVSLWCLMVSMVYGNTLLTECMVE